MMKPFAFSNTIVIVDGVEITGWAEGDDVISIKRRVDPITDKVGAGGSMMISISSDKSGEFSFKLQQTSPSNAYLNEKVAVQEGGAAAGVFAPCQVLFQDTGRNDLAEGSNGYIKRPTDIQRGEHGNNQEWTIVVENLQSVLGSE